jgi:hypothetical protein
VVSYGSEITDCILADEVILPPRIRLERRIVMNRDEDLAGVSGGVRMDELIHFPL